MCSGLPTRWVFGRARYYLVDEAQKAQLAAIVTARSLVLDYILGLIGSFTAAFAYISGSKIHTMLQALRLSF
jgi:hypothetical protein